MRAKLYRRTCLLFNKDSCDGRSKNMTELAVIFLLVSPVPLVSSVAWYKDPPAPSQIVWNSIWHANYFACIITAQDAFTPHYSPFETGIHLSPVYTHTDGPVKRRSFCSRVSCWTNSPMSYLPVIWDEWRLYIDSTDWFGRPKENAIQMLYILMTLHVTVLSIYAWRHGIKTLVEFEGLSDVFFVACLNKLLKAESGCRWQ